MSKSDTVDEKESNSTKNSPGDQLQAARIKQGLSIEDVATRMHLSLGILQSIEENDFDDITAPIFVKGYLRAYARLVSLDEDEMIQRYVEFYSNEDPPINTTSQMAPEISTQDARIKWTTYLVIIILIALLSAWWWNKTQNKSELVSLDTDQSAAEVIIEPMMEESATETSSANEGANSGANEIKIEPLEESSDSIQEPVSEAVIIETTVTEPIATEVAAVESAKIIDTSNAIEEPEPKAVIEASLETPAQTVDIDRAAPTGNDLLHIIVNADTWADIKDANDHRLVYDLLRANLSLQVKGKAPFNVFFGNGHGVEITINKKFVDIASHTQDDNTARLKIGTN